MANKLFLICPFSYMEPVLQNIYGNDIFFLTYSGAVFQQQEYEYTEAIKDFIKEEKISTIYIVNDTSCRFINGIIKNDKLLGFSSEKIIEEIYIDYYLSDFKDQSLLNQQMKLAELNIKNQINEIMNSTILGMLISEKKIEVKGLVTSKNKDQFKEVYNKNNKNRIYEF